MIKRHLPLMITLLVFVAGYRLIYKLASKGIAVLFASSDLPEVMGLADREGASAGEKCCMTTPRSSRR
nr:Arabinose operon regulatory protein [Candidatus Pantoea persica]